MWAVQTLGPIVDEEVEQLPEELRSHLTRAKIWEYASMTKLEDLHAKWMKNPKYRKAYEGLDEEYALKSTLIDARVSAGLTQAQLAKKMKTTQSAVARMEAGKGLPSTRTLTKLAAATGSKLRINFERIERVGKSR